MKAKTNFVKNLLALREESIRDGVGLKTTDEILEEKHHTEESLDATIKAVKDNPTSGPVCDSVNRCEGWEKGMPQIEDAKLLAWTYGRGYTGNPFKWCPWCGRKITWRESS